jgi:hypothetical protein
MCVDKIGVPTKGTLTVSRGDFVTVAVPSGAPPLREAFAGAFPAQNPMDLGGGEQIWSHGGPPETTLGHAVSGQTIEVEVDLEPGTYVLSVGMFFEAGDVVYGVLLDVR